MVPDDFILLAIYTWFLRCIPTAVCRRHWSCAKLEQWDWVIWPRRECRGREGRRRREWKWSCGKNKWPSPNQLILRWVHEAHHEVIEGGAPSRRRNQVLLREKVEIRFKTSLKEPWTEKMGHRCHSNTRKLCCIWLLSNHLWKERISISDKSPMHKRKA